MDIDEVVLSLISLSIVKRLRSFSVMSEDKMLGANCFNTSEKNLK